MSVVTIFLDEARFLEEAIESVLAQTFDNWELCLVDDGSTDRSPRIAHSYAASHPDRIRVVQHPDGGNHGMSASRNLGMSATSGRYLAFLDGDDAFLPEKLERQIDELEAEPRAALVAGRTVEWYSWASRPTGHDHCPEPGVAHGTLAEPPTLLRCLFADVPWSPAICGALFRRETLERVGGFATDFRDMYEDQVLWVKLFCSQPVLVSSGALELYRQHDASVCVQAERDGRYHPWYPNPARAAFLKWADDYLRSNGYADPETLERLAEDLRPVRHPTAPVAVTDVVVTDPVRSSLRGHWLECPQPGDLTGSARLRIFGWVVGLRSEAVAVELLSGGAVVARSAVDWLRPDIGAAFPDDEAARHAGYHFDVPIVGVKPVELSLHAVLADGTTAPLAAIFARRHGLSTAVPGEPVAGAFPRPSASRRSARPGERRGVILLYHRVAADQTPDPWRLSVNPDAFSDQMALLRSRFQPLPLEELVRASADGALPERAVAVTFDDGYADNLLAAKPLLERHDVPATVFVTSGAIGGGAFWWDALLALVVDQDESPAADGLSATGESRYLTLWEELYSMSSAERADVLKRMADGRWCRDHAPRVMTKDQVRQLCADGLVDIGAHTVSHRALSFLTADEQEMEIRTSREQLEGLLRRPVQMFSYPHGKYTAETRRLAREAGFRCALANDAAPVFAGSNLFELPRLAVESESTEKLERQLDDMFDD